MVLVAAFLGASAAALVTNKLSGDSFWGQRIGATQFRRANLPAGGLIAFVGGLIAPAGGNLLMAAGFAAGFTAIFWRWVNPLPPVGTC